MLIHCFKMLCELFGWDFWLWTPRALKSTVLPRQEKGGSEGAQIAMIGLRNPLLDRAGKKPRFWCWWGEISPFGNVSVA